MAKKKARRRQEISKDETKADRFVRVVTPRIMKAVKAIKQIGNCAGASYESTPEQIRQIDDALTTAIDLVRGKFVQGTEPADIFEFGE